MVMVNAPSKVLIKSECLSILCTFISRSLIFSFYTSTTTTPKERHETYSDFHKRSSTAAASLPCGVYEASQEPPADGSARHNHK